MTTLSTLTLLAGGTALLVALTIRVGNYIGDRRVLRRREAEYADRYCAEHRIHQHQGRIPARDTSPNRYLHSDDRSPE